MFNWDCFIGLRVQKVESSQGIGRIGLVAPACWLEGVALKIIYKFRVKMIYGMGFQMVCKVYTLLLVVCIVVPCPGYLLVGS